MLSTNRSREPKNTLLTREAKIISLVAELNKDTLVTLNICDVAVAKTDFTAAFNTSILLLNL